MLRCALHDGPLALPYSHSPIMPARPASNYVRLGLFVAAGLGCLLAALYLVGRQHNMFSKSLTVQADFRNVSGLLTGNNVRLGGITVGTV